MLAIDPAKVQCGTPLAIAAWGLVETAALVVVRATEPQRSDQCRFDPRNGDLGVRLLIIADREHASPLGDTKALCWGLGAYFVHEAGANAWPDADRRKEKAAQAWIRGFVALVDEHGVLPATVMLRAAHRIARHVVAHEGEPAAPWRMDLRACGTGEGRRTRPSKALRALFDAPTAAHARGLE